MTDWQNDPVNEIELLDKIEQWVEELRTHDKFKDQEGVLLLNSMTETIKALRKEGLMYTTEQAAEKANVKPTTIRKAIERKQLKSKLFGTQHMIAEDDLDNWISSRRKPGWPRRSTKAEKT